MRRFGRNSLFVWSAALAFILGLFLTLWLGVQERLFKANDASNDNYAVLQDTLFRSESERRQVLKEAGSAMDKDLTTTTTTTREGKGGEEALYFGLEKAERFQRFRSFIQGYVSQPVTCESKLVVTTMWCDSNPGNGLNFFFRAAMLGFILNRPLVIGVYRKEACKGYLDLKREDQFFEEGLSGPSKLKTSLVFRTCPLKDSDVHRFNDVKPTLRCQDLDSSIHRILRYDQAIDPNFFRFSEFLDNAFLSPSSKFRARMVADIGLLTTSGLVFDELMSIRPSITQQLQGDYKFPPQVLKALNDRNVLKIGLHLRHLPHVVRDSQGTAVTDKRASRCLNIGFVAESTSRGGCLILLATDMVPERDKLIKKLVGDTGGKCQVHFLSQSENTTSAEWGGPVTSQWEKRDPHGDRRSMLEAYLDLYVLSEYSNILVTSLGSSFSTVMTIMGAKREEAPVQYTFPDSSCKDDGGLLSMGYSLCCVRSQRFEEVAFAMRRVSKECIHTDVGR